MRHILQSGQNRCYDSIGTEISCQGSGHDGEWQPGAAWPTHRFEVQDRVVVDHLSGLTWTLDANVGEFPCTWMEAFDQIATMNKEQYGGYIDWRLPNRHELRSLISYQAKNPALPSCHPFINLFLGWYWSSTSAAINPAYAWSVHTEGGRMFYGRKDQAYLFWPVRDAGNGLLSSTGQQHCYNVLGEEIACAGTGQDGELRMGNPWPDKRFIVNGEVVHDQLTDLFWLIHADLSDGPTTWQEALALVQEWSLQRTGDGLLWRLPSINELASLVDCGSHSPALPFGHPFTGLNDGYWTSTTSYFETNWAWVLYLNKGACGVGNKPLREFFVWPVGVAAPSNGA